MLLLLSVAFAWSWYTREDGGGFSLLAVAVGSFVMAVAPTKKTCPECAEVVRYEAKVCRYCQHRF